MSQEIRRGRLDDIIARCLPAGGASRHISLCAPGIYLRCCSAEQGAKLWKNLKTRLKEFGLISASPSSGIILRSRVDCRRICERGPVAAACPKGVGYQSRDDAALEQIIQEHLMGRHPFEEYRFWDGERSACPEGSLG